MNTREEKVVFIGAFDRYNNLLYNGHNFRFTLNNDNKVPMDVLHTCFGPVVTYDGMAVFSDGSGSSNLSFTPGAQVKVQSFIPPEGAVTIPATTEESMWSDLEGFYTDAQRKVSVYSRLILEMIRGITVDAGVRTKAD